MNNAMLVAEKIISGVGGAITALFVILGAAIALGVVSLLRLVMFSKRINKQAEKADADAEKRSELERALKEEKEARAHAEKTLEEKDGSSAMDQCEAYAKIAKEQAAEIESLKKELAEKEAALEKEKAAKVEAETTLAERDAVCMSCRMDYENEIDALEERVKELERKKARSEGERARTLKDSLPGAKESEPTAMISKRAVIKHFSETYGDAIESFARKNKTKNGRLFVADNHYVVKGKKKICFSYVYEDDFGYVLILAREDKSFFRKMRKKHGDSVLKSAFPKNKAEDWYSFLVDEKYARNEVWKIFDESIRYVSKLKKKNK